MHCTILGDSLAMGVAAAAPHCESRTVLGIGSAEFLRRLSWSVSGDRVLISLGANDARDAATVQNLARLRGRVTARQVFWLLPGQSANGRRAISAVARAFGDVIIDTVGVVGPDGIHLPRLAYQAIVQLVLSESD